MASSLAAGASVVYDGDPLRDLALPAFLDKFVRRKAKVTSHKTCLLLQCCQVGEGLIVCDHLCPKDSKLLGRCHRIAATEV